MHYVELPTKEKIDYLDLSIPATGPTLVASWGTQFTPFSAAAWDAPETSPVWQLTDGRLIVSPDGEWVSVYDKVSGDVRITRVGASRPAATIERGKGGNDVWTAVAPGGVAVAWKDDRVTTVRTVPGGEPIVQVKSGWAFNPRFSPGGRWLTEMGQRVFRVFDRSNNYRVFARIETPRYTIAEIADGPTAVVRDQGGCNIIVWDLASNSKVAILEAASWVSGVAISADGQRVLTTELEGGVTLWNIAGNSRRSYDCKVSMPIAAAFSRDGRCAAVGGAERRVVVWDLDN